MAVPGFHLEGPFLALAGAGGLTLPGDVAFLNDLLEAAGPVAAMSINPEVPGIIPVIERLVECGVRVFITHTMAMGDQTQRAIDAGDRHATHFYNVFPVPPVTEPGVRPVDGVEAILADERVTVDFICDGIHVDPVAIKSAIAAKGEGAWSPSPTPTSARACRPAITKLRGAIASPFAPMMRRAWPTKSTRSTAHRPAAALPWNRMLTATSTFRGPKYIVSGSQIDSTSGSAKAHSSIASSAPSLAGYSGQEGSQGRLFSVPGVWSPAIRSRRGERPAAPQPRTDVLIRLVEVGLLVRLAKAGSARGF